MRLTSEHVLSGKKCQRALDRGLRFLLGFDGDRFGPLNTRRTLSALASLRRFG